MPRLTILQTNFTAGEISPRLYGRTDVDRYNNGARKLLNAYPLVHGGAVRRPGTRLAANTKINAKRSRLIPFIVSRDVAYMLEFGDSYVRVFNTDGSWTAIELATPYTEAMLPDIDYAQGADTMFLAHPSVPIQRLRRFSASSFDLSPAPFTVTPFEELGHSFAATLTLSAATVGAGRTATASSAVFLESDVGRLLLSAAGVAKVVDFTSSTVVTVDISAAFAGTLLAASAWSLDLSPNAIAKAIGTSPEGANISLIGSLTRAAVITLSATAGAITVTSSAAIFAAGDVGKSIYAESGIAKITAFTNASTVGATVNANFASTQFVSGSYGITADTFRSDDVGKMVRINGGLLKIMGVGPASEAGAQIVKVLDSDVIAPPLAWSLEGSIWTAANGYPRTVTLHEQRLVAAGSAARPQTIWGSRTGEYLDFTTGVADSDGYSFTIASDEVNPIVYLAAMRNLAVHSYGGEFSMWGGVEKPVTPTNVRLRPETDHGSKGVRPVKVGHESVFVQRSGRKVRSLGYRAGDEEYSAPDLTVLAEHVTESGVTELAYQQEPLSLLWATRADGALLSCTLDREQSVIGWAQHITDGAFESVASLPNGARDDVWVIVRRDIGGGAGTVRYIEVLDDTLQPMLPGAAYTGFPPAPVVPVYGYTVDSGKVFDNAGGQNVFSVPHLAGKTVDIVADGVALQPQVADAAGNVTITGDRLALRTLIGLHFDSEVGLLTPEVGAGAGSAQGNSMRTGEITLRFLDTIGAKVLDGEGNEQDVPFRHLGAAVLDAPPPLFSGLVRLEALGWERGRSELTIVQDQPLPMHLLSVIRKFTVND